MEFFRQFGYLFANMEWFVIVCLVLGLAMVLMEIFQPGFGFFGIIGIVLLFASVILRAIFKQPEDDVVTQIFQQLLLIVIISGGGFGFFLLAKKKGWLEKSTVFNQNETAVSLDYSDGTENFSDIIGKVGVALTALRPSGKALIDGKTYDVVAQTFLIEKDKKIKVVSTEGAKIEVAVNEE